MAFRLSGVAPYVRAVQTASGATAVRIVHSSHRGSRDIEHIGSAHHDAELAVLKAAAPLRMAAGQLEFDFGLDAEASGGPLAITSSRMARLWVALSRAYRVLGFETATGGDEVLRALVLARIIEPTRKLDSLRVIEEARVDPVSYAVRVGESGALRRVVRGVVTTQAGARRARPG
jgi:hypothetical protein